MMIKIKKLTCARYFTFALALGVFFIGSHSLAQETPGSDQERSIYARASDIQIKEAQRFYKYCTQNSVISAERDCKCAASAYLDTRLELGDDASQRDILTANTGKCLKNNNQLDLENTRNDIDLSNVSDKILDEAQAVYEECSTSRRTNKYYDCQCYAGRFLDERIKAGPIETKNTILLKLEDSCKNLVEISGQQYSKCMSMPANFDLGDMPQKEFCECYARAYVKLAEDQKGMTASPSITQAMSMRAQWSCMPNMQPQ